MKVISLIVTIILLMTVMSVPSYATDVAPLINEGNNQELCLSQYTLEDLSNMTPSQFNTLLSDLQEKTNCKLKRGAKYGYPTLDIRR